MIMICMIRIQSSNEIIAIIYQEREIIVILNIRGFRPINIKDF